MAANRKVPHILLHALILTVLIVATGVRANDDAGAVVVTGVVNVTGQIVTDAGESFFIEIDEKGKEVSRLVGRLVEVKGFVKGTEDSRMITVVEYREIE